MNVTLQTSEGYAYAVFAKEGSTVKDEITSITLGTVPAGFNTVSFTAVSKTVICDDENAKLIKLY